MLWALVIVGCAAPPPDYTVKSDEPTVKIPAIRIAVRNKDSSVLPALVAALDSDDPAVRFYADDGLRKLTGENFGYLYYADEKSREPAEQQWKNWLATHYQQGVTTHASTQANSLPIKIAPANSAPANSAPTGGIQSGSSQ